MKATRITPDTVLSQKPAGHYRRCVRCGTLTVNDTYTCTCGGADWTNEYRLTDIYYPLNDENIHRALHAFQSYDMDHPLGMLQYPLLPYIDFAHRLSLRIGLTPFYKLSVLSEQYNRELFIKDEGKNPGGSFKDRESVIAALHCLASGKKRAVIYSSGNAAASAAILASELDIKLITCVSGDTYPEKIEYIRKTGTDVIRIGTHKTNYEEGYRLFAQLNNAGFYTSLDLDNWSVRNPFRVSGDKTTAIEIVRQFSAFRNENGAVPDFVVVPTGNGSCLAGIWKGFRELKNIGAIDRLPAMISAAVKNASPVYKAFHKNLHNRPSKCDLNQVSESDLEIGSVIVAEEGYDSVAATRALYESGGTALVVTRSEIKKALTDLLENEWETTRSRNLLPEPASLVALAAIAKMKQKNIGDAKSSAVAIITGHGSKAVGIMEKMLKHNRQCTGKLHQLVDHKPRQHHEISVNYGKLIAVQADKQKIQKAIRQLCPSQHKKV